MSYIIRQDNNTEIKIHYENIGQGEPIVFHHGNGNSSANWFDLGFVDELKNKFQLILIDSRGYGKSSKPSDLRSYSIKSRADDTIAVLDALKIEQAHCFGGSIGACTCLFLAKYYPKRFKSYILATPFFEQFDDDIKSALKISSSAFLNKLEELLGEKLNNEALRATFLANNNLSVLAANSSEWFNYKEYLQYLKAPTLIYCGEKESTKDEMPFFTKAIAQITTHIFPKLTHKDTYWESKIIAPVIIKFINGLDNSKIK